MTDVEPKVTRIEHSARDVYDRSLRDLDTYYKRFLKAEGYDAELIHTENELKYLSYFINDRQFEQIFRIYPEQCCGQTGLGGSV